MMAGILSRRYRVMVRHLSGLNFQHHPKAQRRLMYILRVMIPLAAPGVFTPAILVFIYAGNEFFFALLITTQQRFQTLPVGIALFQGQYTLPRGEIAAASTVATVPFVLIVFLFQRRIVRGLSVKAIK